MILFYFNKNYNQHKVLLLRFNRQIIVITCCHRNPRWSRCRTTWPRFSCASFPSSSSWTFLSSCRTWEIRIYEIGDWTIVTRVSRRSHIFFCFVKRYLFLYNSCSGRLPVDKCIPLCWQYIKKAVVHNVSMYVKNISPFYRYINVQYTSYPV